MHASIDIPANPSNLAGVSFGINQVMQQVSWSLNLAATVDFVLRS